MDNFQIKKCCQSFGLSIYCNGTSQNEKNNIENMIKSKAKCMTKLLKTIVKEDNYLIKNR